MHTAAGACPGAPISSGLPTPGTHDSPFMSVPIAARRAVLPARFRPKRSLWIASALAMGLCVACAAWLATPPLPRAGVDPVAAIGLIAFILFAIHRLKFAWGSLTVGNEKIVMRTILGVRSIPWPEIGRFVLHSERVGRHAAGALLGVAGKVAVAAAGQAASSADSSPFAPNSRARFARVPFGRIESRTRGVALRLSEGYSWDLYEILVAEALARGVPVIADGQAVSGQAVEPETAPLAEPDERLASAIAGLSGPDRESAEHALIEAGSQSIPHLVRAFWASSEPAVRNAIVRVVSEYRSAEAAPFLGALTLHAETDVWKRAIDGLVTLGGPVALERLRAAAAKTSGERREWIDEAIEQVVSPGDPG